MSKSSKLRYIEDAHAGLNNDTLQTNLKNLQNRFGKGAMAYWDTMDAMEDPTLRDRVKQQRMRTLENLDVVLSVLAENVEKAGGHVFFAKTAEDAVSYALRVAKKNEVAEFIYFLTTNSNSYITGEVLSISGGE